MIKELPTRHNICHQQPRLNSLCEKTNPTPARQIHHCILLAPRTNELIVITLHSLTSHEGVQKADFIWPPKSIAKSSLPSKIMEKYDCFRGHNSVTHTWQKI